MHRLNLELGPKSYQALERLQSALETSSQADTIRMALQTLAKLVDETQCGSRIIIEHPKKDRIELLLPIVASVQSDS